MFNDKYLIDEFDKDIWLYLDKDLPKERMIFWENQIENNAEIEFQYKEILNFLSNYNEIPVDQLDYNRFERIINISTKHEHAFSKIFSWFKNENNSLIPKLAFVSSLSLVAIVMLIFSQKPNPVNKISNNVFDWNDNTTTTQLQDINNSIILIENDNMKRFILYKKTNGEWNKNIYSLENQIKNLNRKIDETSL